MGTAKSVGRIVGVLLLGQIVIAILVHFTLLARVNAAPGFLANAAGSVLQIRVAVLLWMLAGALTLGIAIAALPVFRRYSERMAFLYLALSVVGCATVAVENAAVLNMLSLSQEYAKGGAANELFQSLGAMARSARTAAHYTNVLVGGITAFVLYSILWRFALVPRALTAFGLAAITLQMTAVTMPLLGYRFQSLMLAPVALIQLALILWLMAKGFAEGSPLAPTVREGSDESERR